jgi:hypothetical protein
MTKIKNILIVDEKGDVKPVDISEVYKVIYEQIAGVKQAYINEIESLRKEVKTIESRILAKIKNN